MIIAYLLFLLCLLLFLRWPIECMGVVLAVDEWIRDIWKVEL